MISQITSAAGGGLGGLLNLVPIPGRLTIIPVKEYSPIPIPSGQPPYFTMFNPENWQIEEELLYNSQRPAGRDSEEQRYEGIRAKKLSFDLLIDGTGASGEKREVLADIQLLQRTTGFNGTEHRSNKLVVVWGTQIFKGVLRTMTTKYTLFRANSIPLRATLNLSFIEDTPAIRSILQMSLESADLTHRRLIRENDRLDLLCHYIYKDSRYYLEVARANGLTTFRKLPVGTEMVFPPIEK